MKTFLKAIIIVLSWFLVLSANTVRVPQDQPSIQAGINAAVNGDTVLVADSTYYENINFMGKAITVASYMILGGDTTHRDSTIINGSQPPNPNAASVVTFESGEDTTSVLYGFTITGGSGTMYDAVYRIGGGIYCANSGARISCNKIVSNTINHTNACDGGGIGYWPKVNASARYLIIEHNIIQSNSISSSHTGSSIQGGGIHMAKGRIIGNIIRYNSVSGQPVFAGGGGIAIGCEDNASRTLVVISGNIITHNQVTTPGQYGGWGGGIDVVFCNAQILDNLISDNQAGGSQGIGGGIRLWRSKNISLIKNNTITSNSSEYGGGLAMYNTSSVQIVDNHFIDNSATILGGGIYDTETSGTVISGNEFIGNSTDPNFSAGGGVFCYLSDSITVTGNLFQENSGYQCGGLGSQDSDLLLTNNIFTQNQAHEAGAVGVSQIYSPRINRIINNTITGNVADIAGGIELEAGLQLMTLNNICWGNSAAFAPEIYVKGGTMDVAYSDIRFGADSIQVGSGATLNWLDGNIDSDPLLVADSLANTSPCISAGTHSYDYGGGNVVYCPPEDINGRARPYPAGSNPDMGAWESKQGVVGIEPQPIVGIPKSYELSQNYPNPFNPTTKFEFSIADFGFVSLKVYDITGREVATLVSKNLPTGNYKYEWDASSLASGVYLYQLEAGVFKQTRKMLLVR